jgi:hypothetical protein
VTCRAAASLSRWPLEHVASHRRAVHGGFRFIANGVDPGACPVGVTGVQYIGVQAPEGLTTLTIVPYHSADSSVVAPTVIHRICTR